MSDEGAHRTLYVGNLDPTATEDLLYMLFSQFGACSDCKVIHEAGHDPYAFVKFNEQKDAASALMAMNKRNVLGKEMKLNWASSPAATGKQDTTNHFHVYVGDLSPEIDSFQLRNAFSPFGEMSDCKVIRDAHTQMSKGFAFVCFVRKEEAENAIATMNGQWLGGKTIRTNWASGKGSSGGSSSIATSKPSRPMLNYDDVYNQASSTNTTVYCGGVQSGLTEDILRQAFSEYGTVMDIRIFKEKCFAFVRLDSKEAAAKAIVGVHGTEMNGYQVKCSWGKETSDSSSTMTNPHATTNQNATKQNAFDGSQGYYQQGQMGAGYWGYQQHGYYPMQVPGGQAGYMASGYGPYGYGSYGYPNYNTGSMQQWPGGTNDGFHG